MRSVLPVLAAASVALVACTQTPAPASPAPAAAPAPTDSLTKDRTEKVNEVLALIAGKDQLPAEQVYKNIKLFKGMPAGRVLNIMNRGFSNSLGVSCSHCHVVGEYDREDKPTKQVARDMFAMVTTINETLLKEIKNLKSPNPTVNCSTCHNGRPRPGAGSAASPVP